MLLKQLIVNSQDCKTISDHSLWFRDNVEELGFSGEPLASKVIALGVSSASSSSAFWAGYQMAVQRLFSTHLVDRVGGKFHRSLAAFVVNENRSSKPASWETELYLDSEMFNNSLEVEGKKDFITSADQIDCMLVGVKHTNNHIRTLLDADDVSISSIVKIPVNAEGVALTNFDGMPVFSELQKSRGCFKSVKLSSSNVLPGDGYASYVKPFRLIEDFYVSVTLLGYVIRMLIKEVGEESLLSVSQSSLFILLDVLPKVEASLLSLAPDFQFQDLILESWLTEVAGWINSQVSKYLSNEYFKELSKDLMVLKIGEKARSIRFNRAIETID